MNELTVTDLQSRIIQLPQRKPFMLGQALAEIYQVETRQINQAVKRNPDRFPEDFCFRLTQIELEILRSQNVISLQTNHLPIGFSREGANQLSTVLKSPIAAARSVQIMRAFSAMEEGAPASESAIESGLGSRALRIIADQFDAVRTEFKQEVRRLDLEITQIRARALPKPRRLALVNVNQVGLDLNPSANKPKRPSKGGTHASPRPHDRSGYWRLQGDKRIWVRPTRVNARLAQPEEPSHG